MKNGISIGFVIAAGFNALIVVFSKGFGPDLGAVDPLFGPGGCIGIVLWGLAYLALARRYTVAPGIALVFCLEKAFYASRWAWWMMEHGDEVPALRADDLLTGMFFSSYGMGDAAFMVFFGWVAWKHRARVFGA